MRESGPRSSEALKALDPARPATSRWGWPRRPDSPIARVITLRHAAERYPICTCTLTSRLRRSLAGIGAGSIGSGRPEQGARGTRRGRRRREPSEYTLFGRALLLASAAETRRADAAAGDREAVRPIRWPYYLADAAERTRALRISRAAVAARLHGAARVKILTPADVPRLPSVSPISRCAWTTTPARRHECMTARPRARPMRDSSSGIAEARWRTGQADAARTMLEKLSSSDQETAAMQPARRVR